MFNFDNEVTGYTQNATYFGEGVHFLFIAFAADTLIVRYSSAGLFFKIDQVPQLQLSWVFFYKKLRIVPSIGIQRVDLVKKVIHSFEFLILQYL